MGVDDKVEGGDGVTPFRAGVVGVPFRLNPIPSRFQQGRIKAACLSRGGVHQSVALRWLQAFIRNGVVHLVN